MGDRLREEGDPDRFGRMNLDRLPQAILFDLDDTLIVYERVSEEAWGLSCERYFRQAGFETAGSLRRRIQEVRTWFWGDPDRHRVGRMDLKAARRRIVAAALPDAAKADGSLANEFADYFSDLQDSLIEPFPDTFKVLDSLRKEKIRLGIITNGSSAKQNGKIDRFGLRRYFEFCLVEGDFGVGKPDKRVFLEALDLLDLPASAVWMVGDNPAWDIAPAKRLGMTAIWADRGNHSREEAGRSGADRMISALSELLPG